MSQPPQARVKYFKYFKELFFVYSEARLLSEKLGIKKPESFLDSGLLYLYDFLSYTNSSIPFDDNTPFPSHAVIGQIPLAVG